jgi:hypothetical protein
MMMQHKSTTTICLLAMLLLTGIRIRAADKPGPIPIVLDTDIGGDIDDAFALAVVLDSPELDLRAVTTVSGDTGTRSHRRENVMAGRPKKCGSSRR